MTLDFKMHFQVNTTETNEKNLVWTPKGLKISQLKVFEEGVEYENEQMMIQSWFNMQLESYEKTMKELPPYFFRLPDIKTGNFSDFGTFAQLQCLGFNVSDLDITFKKSAIQFSAYYKEAQYKGNNKRFCYNFFHA
jgi:hypothetical protein